MQRKYIWIGIAVLLGVWLWSSYNGLVLGRGRVAASWAQVETQYQRRFDLVPNLVSTVKGAANFEQETLLQVTEARTKWLSNSSPTSRVDAAQQLDGALSRLLVTVEAYPQLQATQAFRDLMTQLEGTENRIGTARRDYNLAILSYNYRVRRFPTNIVAKVFGFTGEKLFGSVEGSENAPTVDFGS